MFKPGDRVKVSGHGDLWANAIIEGIVESGEYSGEYYILTPDGREGIVGVEYITAAEDAPKSLRDEFAMGALTGLINRGVLEHDDLMGSPDPEADLASTAYAIADAMMKERAK